MRLALICALFFSAGWLQALTVEPHEPGKAADLCQLAAAGILPELRWPNFTACRNDVARFYESRNYAAAWVRDGQATPQAQAIIRILRDAASKGLDPEDYDGSRWNERLTRLCGRGAQPSDHDLNRFDLALTVSAMRYVSDSRLGKVNPKVFCFGPEAGHKQCDLAGLLSRLVNAVDIRGSLAQLEPPFEGYRRTLRAYQTYVKLAREDDGESLPATRKPVEPGTLYPGVPRLERLLRRLGDLPPDARLSAGSLLYQGPLVDAVKRFQARHGLDSDGRLGKSTLQQLNMPLSRRARQLQLALERWRWIPEALSRPPIVVNIPEFRLRAFNDRYEPILEMRVVVGGAYRRQTPVFTNNMTHVIFRPYWNVPYSIQRGELVPKVRKDPSYLAENDYQVRDSSGKVISSEHASEELLEELRSGELSVRQIPGDKNALGHIKFMFPNIYNVYLHGTPAKALFSKSRRDFSHGCIRVEKPEELAAWVLRDQPEWTPERIHEAEQGAWSRQVNLSKPIPVLIIYTTAVVETNGQVFFFDDIYKHDIELDEILEHSYPYSNWRPTSGAPGRRPRE